MIEQRVTTQDELLHLQILPPTVMDSTTLTCDAGTANFRLQMDLLTNRQGLHSRWGGVEGLTFLSSIFGAHQLIVWGVSSSLQNQTLDGLQPLNRDLKLTLENPYLITIKSCVTVESEIFDVSDDIV